MADTEIARPIPFGAAAMAIAAAALVLAVAHLAAGPFAPRKPVEETIVETAVKIKAAARRAVTGEAAPPPAPAPRRDIDRILKLTVLALGAAAMMSAIVALVRNEPRAPAFSGFALGAGVLLVAWLQWIALILCGAIILAAIIANLGDILS